MTPIKPHQIRMRPAHLNYLRRTGDAVLINNLETSQPFIAQPNERRPLVEHLQLARSL